MPLLSVQNLSVSVDDSEILHEVSLSMEPGEVHVLMGPNGAGKSTFGNAVMGNPTYAVTLGTILFNGQDITSFPPDARARAGLFLSFQNPLEVPGISLSNFIRSAAEQVSGEHIRLWTFRKRLENHLSVLDMDDSYLDRDLNVGFSGGEKKKAEILQLLALNPRLAILDETDSGLDVDAVRTVSIGISRFMEDGTRSLLIITHSTRILESLHVDRVHVLVDGRIVSEGDAGLVDEINAHGFERFTA